MIKNNKVLGFGMISCSASKLVSINFGKLGGFSKTLPAVCLAGTMLVLSLVCYPQEAIPVSSPDWISGGGTISRSAEKEDSPARGKNFRVESMPVEGGSELITIFAKVRGLNASGSEEAFGDVPLMSFLRDTLGDDITENDRLRYFWLLSRGDPSFGQKAAAAVPFLYTGIGNKDKAGNKPPKSLIDINPVNQELWDQVFFTVFRRLVVEELSLAVKMPFYQYRKNAKDYRRSSMAQALSLLSVYQELEGETVLSPGEMNEVRSRLLLSGNSLSYFIKRENLPRFDQVSDQKKQGIRGVNWELLRQRCESEGLYFEPLQMPDGGASHALVWVDEGDLKARTGSSFNQRLLNIKNPWTDPRLLDWHGYSEIRWYDEENKVVPAGTPGARERRMIPLALYGLDFPKIPVLLVDFRSNWNPKSREMSRRVIDDVVRNVLSVSAFKNPAVLVGRFLADLVVRRRGIDFNQDSRVTSYAQLKLLIQLNESLDPEFKSEISRRVNSVAINPLQNSAEAEVKLAKQQYKNLMAYAADPEGLPARIGRDRAKEAIGLKHNGTEKFFFALGRIFSLGLYEHREKWTPELAAKLDAKRQHDFHERNLRLLVMNSIDPRIDADEESLKRSLAYVGGSGIKVGKQTLEAISAIFRKTDDREIRELSLSALHQMNTRESVRHILALYKDNSLTGDWREACARYLEMAVSEGDNIPFALSKEIASALE